MANLKKSEQNMLVKLGKLDPDTTDENLIKAMKKEGLVQKEVLVHPKKGKPFIRKQWVKTGEMLSSTSIVKPTDKKLKKQTFEITLTDGSKKLVNGYVLKGIGINKQRETYGGKKPDSKVYYYVITHIPSGRAITTRSKLKEAEAFAIKLTEEIDTNLPFEQFKNKLKELDNKPIQDAHEFADNAALKNDLSETKKPETKKPFSFETFQSLKNDKEKALQYLKDSGITWKEDKHPGINWMRASMAAKKVVQGGAAEVIKQKKN